MYHLNKLGWRVCVRRLPEASPDQAEGRSRRIAVCKPTIFFRLLKSYWHIKYEEID